jgi:transposase
MVLETLRLSTTVWASHFHTKAITHQICIAHLLRDLNYLDQLYNHKWSKAVKILFQIALVLKKQMDIPNYYAHNHRRAQLERRLDFLIAYRFPDEKNELTTFQNRLKKYRNYVFTFLYRQEVPPDNNSSCEGYSKCESKTESIRSV